MGLDPPFRWGEVTGGKDVVMAGISHADGAEENHRRSKKMFGLPSGP